MMDTISLKFRQTEVQLGEMYSRLVNPWTEPRTESEPQLELPLSALEPMQDFVNELEALVRDTIQGTGET